MDEANGATDMITDSALEALGDALSRVDAAGSQLELSALLQELASALGAGECLAVHFSGVQLQVSGLCSTNPIDAGIVARLADEQELLDALIPKILAVPWWPALDQACAALSNSGGTATVLIALPGPTLGGVWPQEVLGLLALAATHIATTMARLVRAACPLSSREIQCLSYLAEGATAKQTARVLGIGQRTVEEYIVRSRQALQVETTVQACVAAMRHGWLSDSDLSAAAETLSLNRPPSSGCRPRTGTQ